MKAINVTINTPSFSETSSAKPKFPLTRAKYESTLQDKILACALGGLMFIPVIALGSMRPTIATVAYEKYASGSFKWEDAAVLTGLAVGSSFIAFQGWRCIQFGRDLIEEGHPLVALNDKEEAQYAVVDDFVFDSKENQAESSVQNLGLQSKEKDRPTPSILEFIDPSTSLASIVYSPTKTSKEEVSIRTQRIFQGILGSAFLIGAGTLATIGIKEMRYVYSTFSEKGTDPVPGLLKVIVSPILSRIGVFFVKLARDTFEYDNPERLDRIRRDNLQLSLREVIEKHGWENIFKYELIHPSLFGKAFQSYAESLPLHQMYKNYKVAEKAMLSSECKTLVLPPLREWKNRIKNLPLHKLVENYPELAECQIFTPEEQLILKEAIQLTINYKGRKAAIYDHDPFLMKTWDAHKTFGYMKRNGRYYKFYEKLADIPRPYKLVSSLFPYSRWNWVRKGRTYYTSTNHVQMTSVSFEKKRQKFLENTRLVREELCNQNKDLWNQYLQQMEELVRQFLAIN